MRALAKWFSIALGIAGAPVLALAADCPALLNHRLNSLRGAPQNLCAYAGKVILAVNTASYCGFTKQYEGLQALHEKYRDQGLVVIGFPANDFGMQEPGSNAEVADFCERTFKVKFPMMEKTSVVGAKANPVFAGLAAASGEAPRWNFHKYLIGRDGKSVRSFGSKVAPESADLVAQIEVHLAKK
ncbi:MAG: glutathione peroxidase [Betaproteobacteria bacterium]|nr:glutathione peroxidase [Betaproteobacteria bacterium]